MQVGNVDLTSPDAFVAGVPHDYFRSLRDEAPLSFSPRVRRPLLERRPPRRHPSGRAQRRGLLKSRQRQPMDVAEAHLANTIDNSIIMTDPPKHNFLRSAIRDAFLPRSVKQFEDAMKVYARNASL